jgi:hypothetical protein
VYATSEEEAASLVGTEQARYAAVEEQARINTRKLVGEVKRSADEEKATSVVRREVETTFRSDERAWASGSRRARRRKPRLRRAGLGLLGWDPPRHVEAGRCASARSSWGLADRPWRDCTPPPKHARRVCIKVLPHPHHSPRACESEMGERETVAAGGTCSWRWLGSPT